MKKIFLLVACLFFYNSSVLAETLRIQIPQSTGRVNISSNSIEIEGLQYHLNKDVKTSKIVIENFRCTKETNICISSRAILSLLGIEKGYAPVLFPEWDFYSIKEWNNERLLAYCKETDYSVIINLKAQKMIKQKLFSNGDINQYEIITNSILINDLIDDIVKTNLKD